jgi:diadenosine tetraphosphate (Ap4A) HIT family hydrolase
MEECLSCLSNSGIRRISPGEIIYEGTYWQVEHAYPTGLLGWLVIILKRHSEALHDLTKEEWEEFGQINYPLMKCVKKVLKPRKEYLCCFSEGKGFKHIHFHIIPKTRAFDEIYSSSRSFMYLKVSERNSISRDKIIQICSKLKFEMQQ